jgi:hypothetical protein
MAIRELHSIININDKLLIHSISPVGWYLVLTEQVVAYVSEKWMKGMGNA